MRARGEGTFVSISIIYWLKNLVSQDMETSYYYIFVFVEVYVKDFYTCA